MREQMQRVRPGGAIDTLLWDEFISKRRPVVIEGVPTRKSEGGKWGVNRWKHDFGYLRRKAGHASVSVEYLDDTAATFGRGKRTTMRFGEFLSRLRTGRYYISSSQQHIGPHGFPDLMVSPLVELGKDLPSRLSWAGNLVPQQVNIWFGSSSSVDGVSSGLHHDYHDNFYVLLRGRKRFRLFPPSEVGRMQTYGEVLRVHENGRIVYKGQEGTNADGSHQHDVNLFYSVGGDNTSDDGDSDSDSDSDDRESSVEPPSFSRALVEDLGVAPAMEFELCAGESLYLPAGWFHEVTSLNDGGAEHMALNYWLHPPTNLKPGAAGFERPYSSNFWPDVFEAGLVRRGDEGRVGGGRGGRGGRMKRRKKRWSMANLKLRWGRSWKHMRFRSLRSLRSL